jgi:hypothetical protein
MLRPVLPQESGNASASWLDAVEVYSSLQLTFDKDKLPAISGIASAYHRKTKDQYLAGLWRSELVESLLWRSVDEVPSLPEIYCAPTWSWASVKGQVGFRVKSSHITLFDLLEASTTPSTTDKFGMVSSGFLRIACPLVPHKYRYNPEYMDLMPEKSDFTGEGMGFADWVRWDVIPQTTKISTTGAMIDTLCRSTSDNLPVGSSDVDCWLAVISGEPGPGKPGQNYRCLLLGLSSSVLGAYERIGYTSLTTTSAGGRDFLLPGKEVITIV